MKLRDKSFGELALITHADRSHAMTFGIDPADTGIAVVGQKLDKPHVEFLSCVIAKADRYQQFLGFEVSTAE